MRQALAVALLLAATSGCSPRPPRFSLTLHRVRPATEREPAVIEYQTFMPDWGTGAWQKGTGAAIDGLGGPIFRIGETRHACPAGCAHIGAYDPALDVPVNAVIGMLDSSVRPDGRVRFELRLERYQAGVLTQATAFERVLDVGQTWVGPGL